MNESSTLVSKNAVATTKPWTRWWWFGNAVTEAEITRHLTLFAEAGFGGVEVSPVYGVRGAEERYVPFLSPRWVELFGFTLREAKRLGMEVDLIAGTGWPFGGSWVSEAQAAKKIDWSNPETLTMVPTGQQVKRAAPGGEGNVVDHFSESAVRAYLSALSDALATLPDDLAPRCFFNDSFEVYQANATTEILTEFASRRGYDLVSFLPALRGDGDPETVSRVRSDYRETIGDLLRYRFIATFRDWGHAFRGTRIRNQAHGSPGNLLDLYGMCDVPETEIFGAARFQQAGITPLRPGLEDFGVAEEFLICKMASSAAHVCCRPLCSSESFTWLGEHGCVTLEQMKSEVDLLLTLGINHLFFHGTPFSPQDVPWPGWLFYATTHCASTNPWWPHLSALNAYIARCQTALQSGVPDNDILLYFPYYDVIAGEVGAKNDLQYLDVHGTKNWLRGNLPDFCDTARYLQERGYGYDLISDRQLKAAVAPDREGAIVASDGKTRWQAILVAGCQRMPVETVQRLADLADAGVTVLFQGGFPSDVPGLPDLATRRQQLKDTCERLRAHLSTGRVRVGNAVDALLTEAGIERETMADYGLEFIRRRMPEGAVTYFITNPGSETIEATITPRDGNMPFMLVDPLTEECRGAFPLTDTIASIHLCLAAGSSLLLKAVDADMPIVPPSGDEALPLPGPWEVAFVDGGPVLPAPRTITELTDWTTWGREKTDYDALIAFSGTARFSTRFDLPDSFTSHNCRLSLGEVCHSARVFLNGADLGVAFCRPWQVTLPAEHLLAEDNHLVIEVVNLMGNRLASLEREKGEDWRPFLFVNIHYKPFDARDWQPLPSGLFGPVGVNRLSC